MKFRTPYMPEPGVVRLSPARPVIMLGSCFSDNLSARMRRCLWRAENPLGVLYNPLSISRAIDLMLRDIGLEEHGDATIFQSYGVYHSWLFDSSVSSYERKLTLEDLSAMGARMHYLLENACALFVTFGTATAWYLADREDYVVGNCHKQPSDMFSSRRLGIEEIVEEWKTTVTRIHEDYPDLPIVFTVSPVRYIKEGFVENARAKATLILAIERICMETEGCHYFPAYEIYMDDLRDYRFYASDLVHPSEEGVDYIWEIFQQTYLGEEEQRILHAGRDIVRRYFHRPNIKVRTAPQEANMKKWREDTLELCYNPFREAYPETLTLEELECELKGAF